MTRSFEQWCEQWEAKLTKSSQRLTPQRRTIAKVLFGQDGHLNVDELHREVRSIDPAVGYATVYRTVKLLEQHEMVRSNKFVDGTARYEIAADDEEHHDHLVCRDCGDIIEFENEEIERLQEVVARQHGFSLVHHRMVLFGRCVREDCDKKLN